MLAEIANSMELNRKAHEEHLMFTLEKERKRKCRNWNRERENLTVENEGLTSQIAEARADIKPLEEEKIQFQKDKEIAEKRAEKSRKRN